MALQEHEIKTQSAANYGWAAVIDADRCSREHVGRYTPKQQSTAETLKDLIELGYYNTGVFVNYRKTFVAVKIADPKVRNKQVAKELDELFAERGYEKVTSNQGIIVRLFKK